jgi:phytoene dehydrogenase-like protein
VTARREFLLAGAALAAAACGRSPPSVPQGEMLATNHVLGHRLRDGMLPRPAESRRARVAIVGGGIGGLSAAWRLRRAGYGDFEILELESRVGGNSRWDTNAVSAYPWGAHYVTVPTRESRATRLLLAELGVLLGDPDAETPRYEERALCHAPQERLYRNGTWEEGLAPLAGRSDAELDEWKRFQARMLAFHRQRGRDGRRAFAAPLDFSSRDPELVALDRLPMEEWLRREGFKSETVHWLVDYACRDDFGASYLRVSAWAGIHYFACRASTAGEERDHVLTWPEGNGFVVRSLMERYDFPIVPRALVFSLEEAGRTVKLGVFLADEKRSVTLEADHVIWAAPFALRPPALDHAPWVVANLTLSEPPYVHHGAPLSWDNVIHDSPSLGYVVATHQSMASRPGPTVLTWYRPLTEEAPRKARQRLLSTSREAWAEAALVDLERPHPEIRAITRRVDVFANGHGMVIPRPGLIWGEARRQLVERRGRVHVAHADASGMSLFEEANDRGVAAAEAVLAALGQRVDSFRWRF